MLFKKMLKRILTNEGIDLKIIERFQQCNFIHFKHLLQHSEWELARRLDLSVVEIQDIITKICVRLSPSSIRVLDMLNGEVHKRKILKTSEKILDAALQGGIFPCSLTEFAGPAGVGKTQMAFTITSSCLLSDENNKVLIIDTENKFSAKRLLEIVQARLQIFKKSNSMEDAQKHLLRTQVVKPKDTRSLLDLIISLDNLIPGAGIKLVVIDSIASLPRKEFIQEDIASRQKILTKIASLLKSIAENYQIPIVIINQAASYDENGVVPALGNSWSHCITTRVIMRHASDVQVLEIVKSPLVRKTKLIYTIDASGVSVFKCSSDIYPKPIDTSENTNDNTERNSDTIDYNI